MTTVLLEPASGKVSGTHTNFPAYIKPSAHTNIGSLTLAEAQSVRVYTDAAKTNEIAREVVSADEIHVKVPSLTSSSTIYFDWDGVRSDYAVTDTYGRNNVWSDYEFVYHMEGGTTCSTGATAGTATGSVTYVSGQVGQSSDTPGNNNSYIDATTSLQEGNNDKSFTVYATTDNRTKRSWYVDNGLTTAAFPADIAKAFGLFQESGNFIFFGFAADFVIAAVPANGTPFIVGASYNSLTPLLSTYVNGSAAATSGVSRSTVGTAARFHQRRATDFNSRLDGQIHEVRGRNSTLSADWFATENQNLTDNAAFWDDSPVGGGGAVLPQFLGFAGL